MTNSITINPASITSFVIEDGSVKIKFNTGRQVVWPSVRGKGITVTPAGEIKRDLEFTPAESLSCTVNGIGFDCSKLTECPDCHNWHRRVVTCQCKGNK